MNPYKYNFRKNKQTGGNIKCSNLFTTLEGIYGACEMNLKLTFALVQTLCKSVTQTLFNVSKL